MRIVPYDSKYFENCINIIQSNTPKFIDYSEHSEYKDYLSRDDKIYFVLFKKSNIIACGGYGSELLKYRIKHIKVNFPGVEIHLNTSQYTYGFFEKFGFAVKQITKNGFAVGMDKYFMILQE